MAMGFFDRWQRSGGVFFVLGMEKEQKPQGVLWPDSALRRCLLGVLWRFGGDGLMLFGSISQNFLLRCTTSLGI